MEEGAIVGGCGCGSHPSIDTDYWKQQICALLKEVDNIERYILRVAPTTSQLRQAGKEKLGPQRPANAGRTQVDTPAGM
jgi:hypothetical protein